MTIYTTPRETPKWDADMEYWTNDELIVRSNPAYKSLPMEWDRKATATISGRRMK